MRLGLSRTRALLRKLGNPERGLQGVLIGGTNGKGSTQAFVAAALRAAGYRVGQTPKPHLVSYRERIQVDGQAIPVDDFRDLLTEVIDADETLVTRHGPSTEFEILTSAAFLYFARVGVEVAVIEVGIGGRLDATNVWQGGVSAITNVELDHMDVLGDSVEAIAREKSMIIKRGDQAAVTGATGAGLAVIRRRAARVHVPLVVTDPATHEAAGLALGMPGAHQVANAAVAWDILDRLAEAGIATVAAEERRTAFAAAHWPGRLELIRHRAQPDVLLDGAHNPHGMAALAAALASNDPPLGGGNATLLSAIMANHWQPGMLDALLSVLPGATMIATSVPGANNSLPPDRLAFEWGAGARPIADPDTALEAALSNAHRVGGPLIVCGSLYLVGHVRAKLFGSQPAV